MIVDVLKIRGVLSEIEDLRTEIKDIENVDLSKVVSNSGVDGGSFVYVDVDKAKAIQKKGINDRTDRLSILYKAFDSINDALDTLDSLPSLPELSLSYE